MAVVDFDLAAYLQEDGDAWSLDGWDLAGTVPSARASDTGAHLAADGSAAVCNKSDAAPLLLDDDNLLLDDLFADQLTNHTTPTPVDPKTQHAAPPPGNSGHPVGGGVGVCRLSPGQPGAPTTMDALQQHLNALQQQQRRLQIPGEGSQPGSTVQATGPNPTPASASEPASERQQTQGGSRKRRLEEPSVLDMARRLLEARGAEQEAQLVAETSALCADNHRLISYLKQLGEKLNKARTENGLLKRMVAETGGAQACALQAEHSASQSAEPARKRRLLGITHSVADKVSALSVQHQVDRRDGAPLPCLRSTPPATNNEADDAPVVPPPVSAPPAASQSMQAGGSSVNALVDLLRIMQSLQKGAQRA